MSQKEVMKRFYILDKDQQAYSIQQQDEFEKYEIVESSDYSGYQLLNLHQSEWSHIHISHKAITVNGIVYKANEKNSKAEKELKSYSWIDHSRIERNTPLDKGK